MIRPLPGLTGMCNEHEEVDDLTQIGSVADQEDAG